LPTRLDPNLTDELAFRIGSAGTLAAISRADFDTFRETLGVRSAAARRRITERHARSLADGLCAAFGELAGKGMRLFADLIAANLSQLLPVLGVAIPTAAQERDAFVPRGGGWLTS
jgi:serine/threonine-protein kinase HipA